MKLVRRIDSFLLIAALLTSGLSAVFFWGAWLQEDNRDAKDESVLLDDTFVTVTASLEPTATVTLTFTATPTTTETPTRFPSNTPTPTDTSTPTNTSTSTNTPTFTPTFTLTPTRTPTQTATASFTATHTPTRTFTPTTTLTPTPDQIPPPQVNRLEIPEDYRGEPLEITGTTVPNGMVTLLDNGEFLAQVPANQIGAWRVYLEDGLPAGSHRLEAYASSPEGVQSEVVPVGFIFSNAP